MFVVLEMQIVNEWTPVAEFETWEQARVWIKLQLRDSPNPFRIEPKNKKVDKPDTSIV